MLQLQYLNTKLQKKHIDQILTNYNIKYTTMKNEIENKINLMIKSFNQDISEFLNNMAEIVDQKQQLKQLERNQNELETVREQLKDKIHEQTKLKREIEMLKMENTRLKNFNSNNSNSNNNLQKFFSPTSRGNNQSSNSILLNQTQKKLKVTKSNFYRTEKKEKNKEIRFKSPSNFGLRHKKKITDLVLDEKHKNNKTIFKKESNLANMKKNILYNSANTEIRTEPNINKNIKSTKNMFNKNKEDTIHVKKRIFKNEKLTKSINNTKITLVKKNNNNKLFNSTTQNFKKVKKIISANLNNKVNNKTLEIRKEKEEDENENEKKINISNKENTSSSENSSSDDESRSQSISRSRSKSKSRYRSKSKSRCRSKSRLSENEEDKAIDEEIDEMNILEDEILSLMEQIKDFKKEKDKEKEKENDKNNGKLT